MKTYIIILLSFFLLSKHVNGAPIYTEKSLAPGSIEITDIVIHPSPSTSSRVPIIDQDYKQLKSSKSPIMYKNNTYSRSSRSPARDENYIQSKSSKKADRDDNIIQTSTSTSIYM